MDRKEISDLDPEVLLLDGFDDAIVGVASRCGQPLIAVYGMDRMVRVLVERDGLTEEEAVEHLEYNVLGAWVGDRTPAVLLDRG